MSCHLKQKMSISPLVQELPRLGAFYRQSAQNERARRESQTLISLLPFKAHAGDRIGTSEFLFGGDQIREVPFQKVAAPGEAARQIRYTAVTRFQLSGADIRQTHAATPTTPVHPSPICDVFVPTEIPDGTRWDRKYRPKSLQTRRTGSLV
jgi:hypothetical protein